MSEAKTGFTRGFFGCFGVLAAVMLAVALGVFLVQKLAAGADGAPKDAASATNAGHCVNALHLAARDGHADPARSSLMFPWRITSTISPEDRLRLRCEVDNRGTRAWVTADVLCDDIDRQECVRVVRYEASDELAIPARR